MLKVFLFTNIIAPYRLALFEQLSQEIDLQVLFAQIATSDRLWDSNLDQYTFKHVVLPYRILRLGNAVQIITPTLLRHLRRHNFDLAIVGDNRQTALNRLLISMLFKLQRRPLLTWTGITPHETRFAKSHRLLQKQYVWYQRSLYKQSNAVIAYGETTRRQLIQMGVDESQIFSGTQVIPSEQLPPPSRDKASLGLAGKTVTLSVNYFTYRKGLDLLIKAFRRVAGLDDVLVLVGSGPAEDDLRALASGDDRIQFPGYQDSVDKCSWYGAADIFVLPTRHDPWGLVVNEAMTFGLPIISTEEAGCTLDLVKKENGFVIPADDVEALGIALQELLTNNEMRQTMGLYSRQIIADYTTTAACNIFLDAINYALEKA